MHWVWLSLLFLAAWFVIGRACLPEVERRVHEHDLRQLWQYGLGDQERQGERREATRQSPAQVPVDDATGRERG